MDDYFFLIQFWTSSKPVILPLNLIWNPVMLSMNLQFKYNQDWIAQAYFVDVLVVICIWSLAKGSPPINLIERAKLSTICIILYSSEVCTEWRLMKIFPIGFSTWRLVFLEAQHSQAFIGFYAMHCWFGFLVHRTDWFWLEGKI